VGADELIGALHRLRAKAAEFHARAVRKPALPAESLDEALTELGDALEELRATEEELRLPHDQLIGGFARVHADRRRLEERFIGAPDAYLETDTHGVMLAANAMAGELLGDTPEGLVGKPLPAFVALEERRAFRTRLSELAKADDAVQRWTFRLRGRTGAVREVDVRLRAVTPSGERGRVVWWVLRPTDQAAIALTSPEPRTEAVEVMSALGSDAEVVLRKVVNLATKLFRETGAGVMLADEHGVPRWVTASDPRAQVFEDAQAALGQGPCVDALHTTEVVLTTDVATDPRWPALRPLVTRQGIGAVLCASLALNGKPVGSFNVFTSSPLEWTAEDAAVVESFAAMTVLLLQTRAALQEQQSLATQLQRALHVRVIIEQAKGVLMARRGLTSDEAWTLLREVARSTRRKAADLAAIIVDNGDLPPEARPRD
jgi:PAS domain S-box-containing protein